MNRTSILSKIGRTFITFTDCTSSRFRNHFELEEEEQAEARDLILFLPRILRTTTTTGATIYCSGSEEQGAVFGPPLAKCFLGEDHEEGKEETFLLSLSLLVA